ncbi:MULTISPECIES: NAD-dependent epimerase/dehydratase family protein [unclassified Oscillibacter]|uniref:NAD-dependent epimerase/dehydratase family protein n=1 Tax=unclassified Oscillibacter TaxID=2629304 RepID=UPI0025CE2D54|nr:MULTISPECIES: NAD(P)-dependent oxidoreductase [unclassified Oscillibacter]
MKKVLVTGATGFVGSHVVRLLADKGMGILAIVRDVSKAEELFSDLPSVRYIACEMEQYQHLPELLPDRNIDIAYHFAWNGTSGDSRRDYKKQLKNVEYLCDLMNSMKRMRCDRIVVAGSIMEFEVIEATQLQGVASLAANIYGAAKCVSHQMAKALASELQIDLVWGIITNAFGAGEVSARFINTTLRKILRHEPLQFTAGMQNYDFIYITDLARAFVAIGEKGKPDFEYTLGSGNARKLKEYVLEIQKVFAPQSEVFFGKAPFTGISLPLKRFSTKQLVADTGFCPEVSFAEGLQRTMDWISSH